MFPHYLAIGVARVRVPEVFTRRAAQRIVSLGLRRYADHVPIIFSMEQSCGEIVFVWRRARSVGYEAGVVILFHYTEPGHLPAIAERGLVPSLPDPEFMTKGKPVVWLTTGGDEWWERSGHGEPVRIVVRLPTNSRPLAHYAKWLRRHFGAAEAPGWILTCDDLLAHLTPQQQADWYVYFGVIAPARLTLPTEAV